MEWIGWQASPSLEKQEKKKKRKIGGYCEYCGRNEDKQSGQVPPCNACLLCDNTIIPIVKGFIYKQSQITQSTSYSHPLPLNPPPPFGKIMYPPPGSGRNVLSVEHRWPRRLVPKVRGRQLKFQSSAKEITVEAFLANTLVSNQL